MRKVLGGLAVVLGAAIAWRVGVDGLAAMEFVVGAAFGAIVCELLRGEEE